MNRTLFVAAFLALFATGCTHEVRDDPRLVGFFAPYKKCRVKYAEIDARIDAAGVRDAGYYRIPGFPYLRTDRTLASFRNEAHTFDEISGWIRHMREYDQEAREFEYINLGLSVQQAGLLRDDLLNCGRGLAGIELDEPADLKKLIDIAQPPDDYSGTPRALGVYPLAVPFLRAGVAKHQTEVARTFARPLSELGSREPLSLFRVKATVDPEVVAQGYGKSLPDELGFPGLFDSAWLALAEINAPTLWIEAGSGRDRPGAPVWTTAGVSVDTSKPVVYYQIEFTRFGSQRLAQIVYFVWFKGRAAAKAGADDAGIDGFIWRVTLDAGTHPIVYESLHMSGRDHLWFPTAAMTRRGDDTSYWHEPALMPQAPLAGGPQALRLAAGSHALQRVVAADQADAKDQQDYELRRYEDLLTLERPDGTWRSLFDDQGLVQGSGAAAGEGWPYTIGVTDGLRQLGHHPTTTIGRVEFDDPFALEAVFVVPPAAPVATEPASSASPAGSP